MAELRDRQAGLAAALAAWVRPQQRAAFSAWLRFLRAAAETRHLVRRIISNILSTLQCTSSCVVGFDNHAIGRLVTNVDGGSRLCCQLCRCSVE